MKTTNEEKAADDLVTYRPCCSCGKLISEAERAADYYDLCQTCANSFAKWGCE